MLFALLLAAQVAAPATAEPPQKALRIGVVDVSAGNVDPLVADVVEDALLIELRKLSRASVIGWKEIRSMLDAEADKQSAGCTDESCLSEIADAAGVDLLVVCSLARTDQSVMGLRRIDQREAKVTGNVQKLLTPAGGEEFLAALGPAVEELFPDLPLKKGAVRGVAPEMAVALNPPPLPPWLTLTTAGVGAATVVTGLVVVGVAEALHQDFIAYAASGTEAPIEGRTLNDKGDAANAVLNGGVVTAGAGLVVVAASAAMFFFTDWNGAATQERE